MNVSTIWDMPVTEAELQSMWGTEPSSEAIERYTQEIQAAFTAPFEGKMAPFVRGYTGRLDSEPVADTILDTIDHKDVWPLVMEMLADTTNPKAVAVLQALAKVHVDSWAYECAVAEKQ